MGTLGEATTKKRDIHAGIELYSLKLGKERNARVQEAFRSCICYERKSGNCEMFLLKYKHFSCVSKDTLCVSFSVVFLAVDNNDDLIV